MQQLGIKLEEFLGTKRESGVMSTTLEQLSTIVELISAAVPVQRFLRLKSELL